MKVLSIWEQDWNSIINCARCGSMNDRSWTKCCKCGAEPLEDAELARYPK